jgi:hypothetical protein
VYDRSRATPLPALAPPVVDGPAELEAPGDVTWKTRRPPSNGTT